MLTQSITKNSLVLGVFALVTAGILGVTYSVTEERIAAAEKRAAEKALLEIIPATRQNNDMLSDVWQIPLVDLPVLGLSSDAGIHLAKYNGNPVAFIVPLTAPDGYSGDINIIVGINMDGSVAGVRALSHKETPGLGDKIDLNKDTWILGFNGKSLVNPNSDAWLVKKDGGVFDSFTGATITPRAVVRKVKIALEYFAKNKQQILSDNAKEESITLDKTVN